MKIRFMQVLGLLISLFVIVIQPSSAQQNAFVACIDASGKPSICVGNIPESQIQQGDNNRVPVERGCGSSTLSWARNGIENVPGISNAFLKTYCRDNRTIVIWTDVKISFFGGRTGNPLAKKCGRPYRGFPREEDWGIAGEIGDDPCISYDFSLFKSGEGVGDINGTEYSLTEGDIFLISTSGGDVTVRQIDYDLTSVSTEDIQLLARRYPPIRSFFEEQAL